MAELPQGPFIQALLGPLLSPNYPPECPGALPGPCWGLLEAPATLQRWCPHPIKSKKSKQKNKITFKGKFTSVDILEGGIGYVYYNPLFLCFLVPDTHI